ncbi:hypothetical protein ACSBR2_015402 [Camellia fascicularis]
MYGFLQVLVFCSGAISSVKWNLEEMSVVHTLHCSVVNRVVSDYLLISTFPPMQDRKVEI